MRRPLLRRWLVFALLSVFAAFSFALVVAVEEAYAQGKLDGGGALRSGGGDSGGGNPRGDAVGGATKKLDSGGGGGDRSGRGGDLLNDGGAGGGGGDKKQGPLSDSPVTADKPKPALANTEPVTKKASGDLLDGASGERTDRVLSSEPILMTTSPTLDPTPTLAPAVEGTKDALEGIARPASTGELVSTGETIQPLIEGVDKLASPIADQLAEAAQQPLPLDVGTVAPIREALDPVLEKTAEPLLKTTEPLLKPVVGPVLGEEVAPTTPLEGTPAAPTPAAQAPAAELYAPASGGLPALSPSIDPGPWTAAFEPAVAPILFDPFIVVGEGASLPVMEAVEAPATLSPTVLGSWASSSVLGATQSTALPPLPAPNHAAAGAVTVAPREITASSTSLGMDAREVSTMPGLSVHHRLATLGTNVLGAAPTSWMEGFLRDASSPFSPAALPVAGSASGGFAGAGSGLGLGLLGVLALILALARVDTLLRSARETFGASSYLQLAIERPG